MKPLYLVVMAAFIYHILLVGAFVAISAFQAPYGAVRLSMSWFALFLAQSSHVLITAPLLTIAAEFTYSRVNKWLAYILILVTSYFLHVAVLEFYFAVIYRRLDHEEIVVPSLTDFFLPFGAILLGVVAARILDNRSPKKA